MEKRMYGFCSYQARRAAASSVLVVQHFCWQFSLMHYHCRYGWTQMLGTEWLWAGRRRNNISSIYHLKFCIVRKVALKRLVKSTFFCFSSSDPFFVSHDSESGALSDGLVVTELKYATKSAPMLGVGNTLQSRQRAREMQVDFFAGATFSHLQ